MITRDYDIVLFGATGDAGRAMAQYLSRLEHWQCWQNWAVAGPSAGQLQALRNELVEDGGIADCGVMLVDCLEDSSLRAATRRARLVLNAGGSDFGEMLIKACIRECTHYADITGEFYWVAQMRRKYEDWASDKGICLCSFCGYASVPAELALIGATEVFSKSGRKLHSVELVTKIRDDERFPRRSLQVLEEMLGSGIIHNFKLFHGLMSFLPKGKQAFAIRSLVFWCLPLWSLQTRSFTLPNVIGLINLAVVYNTAHELGIADLRYSDRFYWRRGWRSLWGLLPIVIIYGIVAWILLIACIPGFCSVLREALHFFIESHYRGSRASTVEVHAIATAFDGAQVNVLFRCPGDPGVYCTARLACECALTMLDKGQDLPTGFTTPGFALKGALESRLRSSGVMLEVM